MIRWLAVSIVTLAAAAVASDTASPTPTTQPSVTTARVKGFNFAQQNCQLEQRLHELTLQIGRLGPLPEFHFDVQAAPNDVKPYGTPFRFNGLTVYVEPIALAATGPK
jgi:hypothetical protein